MARLRALLTAPGPSALGPAAYLQIERTDGAVMSWAEQWAAVQAVCPGRWAVSVMPPRSHLIDQRNRYHFAVLAAEPVGLTIGTRVPGPVEICEEFELP